MLISTDSISLLRLLQIADSALPIGGSAHSFGLETMAEEGALTPDTIEDFLRHHLEEGGRLDAAFVRQAWKTIDHWNLNQEYAARKPARESRDASLKLGRRFVELFNRLAATPGGLSILDPGLHYCIAFGAAGALLDIPERLVVLGYLHQSMAGLISACQRLMPLGQSAASKILWNLKPAMVRAAQSEEVWCFSPYPELASMRHGSLETRLFIS